MFRKGNALSYNRINLLSTHLASNFMDVFIIKFSFPQFNRLHDWTSLNGENINATRTVQQIKANLQEIEKVRHQVLEEDLDAFDNKINDMRESAIQSVLEFTSLSGTQTEAAGK